MATAHTKTLKDFGIQSVSKVQGDALTWLIARCFFTCVIPFKVVEHWSFVGMIRALAPGVVRHLPSRRGLSRAWLPKIYLETRDRMNARLEKKGKKTLILDGYKDRRNRHVINIAWGVRGFVAYLKTVWFGSQRHTGKVYFDEVVSVLGDDDENTIAIVADNTGSMSSMQNGLFGLVAEKCPQWYLIGWPVNVHDLLQEDVANLPFIASVVNDVKFVVVFVLKYSLVPRSTSSRPPQTATASPGPSRPPPALLRFDHFGKTHLFERPYDGF